MLFKSIKKYHHNQQKQQGTRW